MWVWVGGCEGTVRVCVGDSVGVCEGTVRECVGDSEGVCGGQCGCVWGTVWVCV